MFKKSVEFDTTATASQALEQHGGVLKGKLYRSFAGEDEDGNNVEYSETIAGKFTLDKGENGQDHIVFKPRFACDLIGDMVTLSVTDDKSTDGPLGSISVPRS